MRLAKNAASRFFYFPVKEPIALVGIGKCKKWQLLQKSEMENAGMQKCRPILQ